jgi:penicillin-binding protein 1A
VVTTEDDSPLESLKPQKKKKGFFRRLLYLFYGSILVLSVFAGLFLGGAYFYFTKSLPQISSLKDYKPPIITTVYSDDNRKTLSPPLSQDMMIPADSH